MFLSPMFDLRVWPPHRQPPGGVPVMPQKSPLAQQPYHDQGQCVE